MVKKIISWADGVKLEDHTKKKHQILKEYLRQYLITRCQLPQQERFRLAIIDGFSGAGLYECGSFGSPLIFVQTLIETTNEINLIRLNQNTRAIQVECLLVLNDSDQVAIEQLRKNIAPLLIEATDTCKELYIQSDFYNSSFDKTYKTIKEKLISEKINNVFFNLDQCGYSHVTSAIIKDIIESWRSPEVLLTFMISSMLAYLSPKKNGVSISLEPEVKNKISAILDSDCKLLAKKEWLGEAEKIVYSHLKDCAPYVSPFSINNPDGWRYWLMHFAKNYRARQVYNDVLHSIGSLQAHFGRSGLNMLSYDPNEEGTLYLFDNETRHSAKTALYDEIPRLVEVHHNSLTIKAFYEAAYSETPAHSNDINEMIIENTDLEVVTETGGIRRSPNAIKASDTLRLKTQRSMFFMFNS